MGYSKAPWPRFEEDEVEAAADVLRSGRVNYWTGEHGRTFEREFAEFTGLEHAVFVANGTVALELALRALDLPAGSDVVTTPHTFIATSSAIVAAGLRPVFADIDLETGNITPETIASACTDNTSAVIVVHLGGWPARMPEIQRLCRERGLRLIEDCAQAHGAMIGDQHVGTFSDIAAWSFCQDKIITTAGEGGMVGTNDRDLWLSMWSYKDHGKSWQSVYEREHPPGFRWLHDSFGTNWRGTEIQAAVGRAQYRKLPDWHAQRTENAMALARLLEGIPGLRVPQPFPGETHAYYRLYAVLETERLLPGWTRDKVIGELSAQFGVPAFSGSCAEIYREMAFANADLTPVEPLTQAAQRQLQSLAFLVHPGLDENDMKLLAGAVRAVLADAVDEGSPSGELHSE